MKATVNSDVGVKVFTEMRNENKFMPPGVEQFGLRREPRGVPPGQDRDDDLLAALRPLGRRLRHRREGAELGAEVAGRRQGRLRAAAGRSSGAGAPASRCRSPPPARTRKPAYLFIQWLNSEEISIQRVQLPYTLRDPFRDSHYHEPGLPRAVAGREGLSGGAASRRRQTGLLDLSLLQTDKYEEALRQGISSLWAGEDPKAILDRRGHAVGRDHRQGRRRQAEGRLRGLGGQVRRLSEVS